MRPILYLAIQKGKRYRKKHNLPDYMEITEKDLQKRFEENEKKDYDCFTVASKLRKGLDLKRVDLEGCSSWLIKKEGNPEDKVIYYIHGGGFVNGSTRQGFRFVSYAVNNFGYNMYSVDYRLTPNYTCKETIKDCEDGYRYLLEHYSPDNIILMGESAGGNLVLALPQRLKDVGLPLPGGIVSCSPVVQFMHYPYSYYECSCKTDCGIIFGINDIVETYRGELPKDSPYISPLCGDLSNYPPVYLDASDVESLRDEARMMFVRLKEEGCDVEYHELKDFFHAMLTAPQFGFVRKEEYPLIISFLNRIFRRTDEK